MKKYSLAVVFTVALAVGGCGLLDANNANLTPKGDCHNSDAHECTHEPRGGGSGGGGGGGDDHNF